MLNFTWPNGRTIVTGRRFAGRLAAAACMMSVTAFATAGGGDGIWYVDADAPDGGDGTSWADASNDLRAALDSVPFGSEIRVAAGVYTPAAPGGPRGATFQLRNGVVLRGGYVGLGAPDPDANDPALHPTVLSGDLNGDDADGGAALGDNVWHVVNGDDVDGGAVLDGFVITGGVADVWPEASGGGLTIRFGSPIIRRCVFRDNVSSSWGGAVFAISAAPVFIDCTFLNNVSLSSFGGAMAVDHGAPQIINTRFLGNEAQGGGGALFNFFSVTQITNSVFSGNVSEWRGGAIAANQGALFISNATFSLNVAAGAGASIVVFGDEALHQIDNTIIWGEDPQDAETLDIQLSIEDADVLLDHVAVQGWSGGAAGEESVFLADPLFANPLGADGVAGTIDDDLALHADSPYINAGDDTLLPLDAADLDGDGDVDEPLPVDLNGDERIMGGAVDLGGFESAADVLFGDLNGDKTINIADIQLLLEQWGRCTGCAADLNDDGVVGGVDLAILISLWS